MKLKQLFSILMLVLLLSACGGGGSDPSPAPTPTPPPVAQETNAQKIAKTWKVDKAFLKGQDVTATGEYANFRLTLNADAQGNASTYSVTLGGAPSKPNWNSNDTGNWSFRSGTSQIDFGGTTVSVIGSISDTRLTLEWSIPIDVDKTAPTYRYELVPN